MANKGKTKTNRNEFMVLNIYYFSNEPCSPNKSSGTAFFLNARIF